MKRLSSLTEELATTQQRGDALRALSAIALSRHSGESPAAYFRKTWPGSFNTDLVDRTLGSSWQWHQAAATVPGTVADATWGGALVPQPLITAFAPAITAASAVLRAGFAPAPFNTKVLIETATSSHFAWAAEGAVKPFMQLTLASQTLPVCKIAGLTVVTAELMKLAAEGSVPFLERALAAGLARYLDTYALSAAAAVVGERPAGLLAGVAATVTTGTTSARLSALLAAFYAAAPEATAPTLFVAPATAGALAGDPTFNLGATGITVVTTPAATDRAILVDADRVFLARGGLELGTSDQAACELRDDPTSPPTAAVIVVSFWQHNLVGIKCEQFVSWVVLPPAVAWTVLS